MFALVVCPDFTLQCQLAQDTSLHGQPLVLLNASAVVTAASPQAVKLGAAEGQPWPAFAKAWQGRGIQQRPDAPLLYAHRSQQLEALCRTLTTQVITLTNGHLLLQLKSTVPANLRPLGRELQQAAQQSLGLPLQVGLAPTPALAAVACQYAAATPKTGGVFSMVTPLEIEAVLAKAPLKHLGALTPGHLKQLHGQGIHTALHLRQLSPETSAQLPRVRQHLVQELQGMPSLQPESLLLSSQTVLKSRLFPRPVGSLYSLHKAAHLCAQHVATTLQRRGQQASQLMVQLETLSVGAQPACNQGQHLAFAVPTNTLRLLARATRRGLRQLLCQLQKQLPQARPSAVPLGLVRVSVLCTGLQPVPAAQLSMFDLLDMPLSSTARPSSIPRRISRTPLRPHIHLVIPV